MTIVNTAKDPMIVLLVPGLIEESEASGQRQLVASELLPSDMGGERLLFERMGFKFGDFADGDPMFIRAELPAGWSKRRTDHSMWSEIVDARGAVRVNIFYKAAFYDRSANMSLRGRWFVQSDWSEGYRTAASSTARVVDMKTGMTLFEVTESPKKEAFGYVKPAVSVAEESARAWIAENRPGNSIEAWFVD